MQEFNIDLGSLDIFTTKNFSFDILNTGSADLQVDKITLSSNNISLMFTKTPFYILQNTSFSMSGYLKIVTFSDSTGIDFIDLNVSWEDEIGTRHTDTQRYLINYKGFLAAKFTEVISTDKIPYINDALVLYMEFNEPFIDQTYPNMVIKSVDSEDLYIFPKIYRLSDKILAYVYKDNTISNIVIDSNIVFNLIYEKDKLDIHNISYRSI